MAPNAHNRKSYTNKLHKLNTLHDSGQSPDRTKLVIHSFKLRDQYVCLKSVKDLCPLKHSLCMQLILVNNELENAIYRRKSKYSKCCTQQNGIVIRSRILTLPKLMLNA